MRDWRKLLTVRDAILSICMTLCLNVIFFTHVPVTAERSVSIFVLGAMSEEPERIFTEPEIRDYFIQKYVIDNGALEKRFLEQEATGTIRRQGGGFAITDKGRILIRFYGFVADCFHIGAKG